MVYIPMVPNRFFALLQQKFVVVANSYSRRKFSAAFTSRTKPDRSDNLISNNKIAAEMSMFSILFMPFCPVLKRTTLRPCLFRFRRRSDTSEMVEHLIDLVPRLLWLIYTKLYYKCKLFRRFPASSLLARGRESSS